MNLIKNIDLMKETLGKKPTHEELAEYLSLSKHTVKKYPKKKLDLMLLGLWVKRKTTILNKF